MDIIQNKINKMYLSRLLVEKWKDDVNQFIYVPNKTFIIFTNEDIYLHSEDIKFIRKLFSRSKNENFLEIVLTNDMCIAVDYDFKCYALI